MVELPVKPTTTTVQLGDEFKLSHYLNPLIWTTDAEWKTKSPFIDIPNTCQNLAKQMRSTLQHYLKEKQMMLNMDTGEISVHEGASIDMKDLEEMRQKAVKMTVEEWNCGGLTVTTRTLDYWCAKSLDELLDFLSHRENLAGLFYNECSMLQKALSQKGIDVWIDYSSRSTTALSTEGSDHILRTIPIVKELMLKYPLRFDPSNPYSAPIKIRHLPANCREYCEGCKQITDHQTLGEFSIANDRDRCTLRIRRCQCSKVTVVPNISVG